MTEIRFPADEFTLLFAEIGKRLDPAAFGMLTGLCGHPIHTLTAERRWPEMAEEALRSAQRDLWFGDFLRAVTENPDRGKPLIDACARGLAAWRNCERLAAPYAPRDRKAALVLFNDAHFVDRTDQRTYVYRLVQRQGSRVMLVRGDSATGKSHMGLFVRHLIDPEPQVKLVPIRIKEMGGDMIGPIDLMTELADAMGFSIEDAQWDSLAQEQRQAEKLSRWFAMQTIALRKRDETWLLVIDGLNDPRVSSGTLEMMDRLVIAGSRGDLNNTSVLLLGMSTPTPALVDGEVFEITLLPLTENDFRSHVVDLARVMGRDLQSDGTAVVMDFLLKDLSFPLGHEGMALAGKRLRQVRELIEKA